MTTVCIRGALSPQALGLTWHEEGEAGGEECYQYCLYRRFDHGHVLFAAHLTGPPIEEEGVWVHKSLVPANPENAEAIERPDWEIMAVPEEEYLRVQGCERAWWGDYTLAQKGDPDAGEAAWAASAHDRALKIARVNEDDQDGGRGPEEQALAPAPNDLEEEGCDEVQGNTDKDQQEREGTDAWAHRAEEYFAEDQVQEGRGDRGNMEGRHHRYDERHEDRRAAEDDVEQQDRNDVAFVDASDQDRTEENGNEGSSHHYRQKDEDARSERSEGSSERSSTHDQSETDSHHASRHGEAEGED